MGGEYRIHVTLRSRGQPIFTSIEYKTEFCEDLDELLDNIKYFVIDSITENEEGRDDTDDD